jgi:hypothetical protein
VCPKLKEGAENKVKKRIDRTFDMPYYHAIQKTPG